MNKIEQRVHNTIKSNQHQTHNKHQHIYKQYNHNKPKINQSNHNPPTGERKQPRKQKSTMQHKKANRTSNQSAKQ